MKKIIILLVAILVFAGALYQCSNAKTSSFDKEEIMSQKKVLVAYYSYSGNTKTVAEKIQKLTGGDIVEIVPVKPYPTGYNEVVELAKNEKNQNIRPEIKPIDKNISDYDVIFLGTPVWWYTMASPVKTFLANNKFDGKIIAPFCTHGGGGASSTYTDMKNLAPKAEFKPGFTSYGNTADEKMVADWIKNLNL